MKTKKYRFTISQSKVKCDRCGNPIQKGYQCITVVELDKLRFLHVCCFSYVAYPVSPRVDNVKSFSV